MMKQISLFLLLIIPSFTSGQQERVGSTVYVGGTNNSSYIVSGTEPMLTARVMENEPFDDQDDPAYSTYKEAYNLILDEAWEAARMKLGEVVKKYPKSDYVDDAEYWSAYALHHIDREKGEEAYKAFMKKYPKSAYYDDAVADLASTAPVAIFSRAGDDSMVSYVGTTPKGGFSTGFVTVPRGATAPMIATTPRPPRGIDFERSDREFRRQMAKSERDMRRHGLFVPGAAGFELSEREEEKLDEETKLRLEALYAIGDMKEDENSFNTFKKIALDFKAHRRLRITALDYLSDVKRFDAIPIFIEVAKRDTNEEMQSYALDHIAWNDKDKSRSVATLIELFKSTPKNKPEQRRRIFYSIADVGSPTAVDFLASVARSKDDFELRKEAIYYLGSIGSDRARTVLYEILGGGEK